jgi:hypothetical protein
MNTTDKKFQKIKSPTISIYINPRFEKESDKISNRVSEKVPQFGPTITFPPQSIFVRPIAL